MRLLRHSGTYTVANSHTTSPVTAPPPCGKTENKDVFPSTIPRLHCLFCRKIQSDRDLMFSIIHHGIRLFTKIAWRQLFSDLPFFWKIPVQYFHMTAHAELLSLSLISNYSIFPFSSVILSASPLIAFRNLGRCPA